MTLRVFFGVCCADAATPGFRDEVQAQLEEIRAALPAEIRDVLGDDWLDELIETGVETMALRLGTGRTDQ